MFLDNGVHQPHAQKESKFRTTTDIFKWTEFIHYGVKTLQVTAVLAGFTSINIICVFESI